MPVKPVPVEAILSDPPPSGGAGLLDDVDDHAFGHGHIGPSGRIGNIRETGAVGVVRASDADRGWTECIRSQWHRPRR